MTETSIAIAFLDASVLYPALLRNILMRLALHGLFRAHWSTRVHEEWITALLRDRSDLDPARVERIRTLMDTHIQDARVEDYEHHIDSLTLPDANDRHVLAAAIHCGASVIVTANLRDFPASGLAPFAIEACHPDAFILGLFEHVPSDVLAALRQLRGSFKNPPKTAADLLVTMRKQGLAACADALGAFADDI
jgi:PIN domain